MVVTFIDNIVYRDRIIQFEFEWKRLEVNLICSENFNECNFSHVRTYLSFYTCSPFTLISLLFLSLSLALVLLLCYVYMWVCCNNRIGSATPSYGWRPRLTRKLWRTPRQQSSEWRFRVHPEATCVAARCTPVLKRLTRPTCEGRSLTNSPSLAVQHTRRVWLYHSLWVLPRNSILYTMWISSRQSTSQPWTSTDQYNIFHCFHPEFK